MLPPNLNIGGGQTVVVGSTATVNTGVLSIDVGRGSSFTVDGQLGTLNNFDTLRVVAGADAPTSTYTPINVANWNDSGTDQPVGGTWNTNTEQFTASTVASSSGAGGGDGFDRYEPATADADSRHRGRHVVGRERFARRQLRHRLA